MLRSLCVLLFVAHSSILGAERFGEIRGTVKSEEGERLEGAQVTIRDLKLGAVATGDGHFVIKNVPAGRHQVIVWMTGYQSQMQRATVWEDATIQLDFTLKTRVISLEPIEITAEVPRRAVTATMVEMDLKKIPSAVEIITEEEIEEMGALTVADALMESQSLYLQGDSERDLAASLRGLRTTHTLILIDGRRVAVGLRDNINLDDIPTSMIDRIEIVRGPISALYGSDAIGGVINIVTKEPPEKAIAGLTVNYGLSKYGEAQNPFLKGYLAESTGGFGYSLSASIDRKNQYDRYKNTIWTDGDRKRFRSGSGLFSFDPTPNQRFQGGFDLSFVERKGIRPFSWGDAERRSITQRKSYFMEYKGKPGIQSDVILRAYQYHFETDIDLFPIILGPTVNPFTQSEESYQLVQDLNQIEGRWSQSFLSRHTVTMGAEYRSENRKDKRSKHDVSNSALFLQDVLQVSDPFLLVVGARYDSHSDFGATLSPKASLTFALHDNFRLKSSYGKGIRAPSIFELYIESPTKESFILPNLSLIPEESRSYEFGIEGDYKRFSGVIRFFRNDLKDMINTVQTGLDTLYAQRKGGGIDKKKKPWIRPLLQYTNIAKAMTQGFEINASIKLSKGFVLSGETSILDTKDKTTGLRLFNRPDLLNNLKLAYENPVLGIKANLRATSVGSRQISDIYKAEGYTFIHFYASHKLSKSTEAYFGINNLLNNDPNVYGYLEGAGPPGTFFYWGLTFELRGE